MNPFWLIRWCAFIQRSGTRQVRCSQWVERSKRKKAVTMSWKVSCSSTVMSDNIWRRYECHNPRKLVESLGKDLVWGLRWLWTLLFISRISSRIISGHIFRMERSHLGIRSPIVLSTRLSSGILSRIRRIWSSLRVYAWFARMAISAALLLNLLELDSGRSIFATVLDLLLTPNRLTLNPFQLPWQRHILS